MNKYFFAVLFGIILLGGCQKDNDYKYVDKVFSLNTPRFENGKVILNWTQLGISKFGGSYRIYVSYSYNTNGSNVYLTGITSIVDRKITTYTIDNLSNYLSSDDEYKLFRVYIASGDLMTNYQSFIYSNGQFTLVNFNY